jgi:predicted HNH restriction endonuclease
MYGSVATGFIQVHHIIPLSEIGKSYNVDPVKDLIPLCANCHSVVHLVKPAMTIDELKKLINTKCSDNLSLTDNNI